MEDSVCGSVGTLVASENQKSAVQIQSSTTFFSIIFVEKNWKKRPVMFPLLQENNRKYLMYFGQISLLEEMLFKRKCPRKLHN